MIRVRNWVAISITLKQLHSNYGPVQACTVRAKWAVRQTSLTDAPHFPKQEIILRKTGSYLHLPSVDAFQMRFVIHVFAVTLVIIVTGAVAVAVPLSTILLISCAHEAPLSPGLETPVPASPAPLGWVLHTAVSAVWISPPPHTPLNASLLLQHIIFADHKIHPQRFPGRTWH